MVTIVRVALTGADDVGLAGVGEMLHVAFDGQPLYVSVTAELNDPVAVMARVPVAVDPAFTVALFVEPKLIAKSGWVVTWKLPSVWLCVKDGKAESLVFRIRV